MILFSHHLTPVQLSLLRRGFLLACILYMTYYFTARLLCRRIMIASRFFFPDRHHCDSFC